MATYIVSTDNDLESVITANSMVAGDDITINSGAVLTCTESPSILMGYIFIQDGKFIIDGTSISAGNVINWVGDQAHQIRSFGLGEFEVTGDWYSLGTTDGTDGQVVDISSYWGGSSEDVIPAIWIETGRRIDFDGSSGDVPEVDDWVYKTSDLEVLGRIVEVQPTYLVVKFLTGSLADNDAIQVRKVVDNNGPDFQITWTALVNNASGDIKEAGVYQSFANVANNQVNEIANFGNNMGGFVFYNLWQSNSITLGGPTTGGFQPPNGCDIRVPNVHFSTSTSASFPTTTNPGNNELSRYGLYTTNAGSMDFDKCNFGSAYAATSGARKYHTNFVGANLAIGSVISSGSLRYIETVVPYDCLSNAFVAGYAFRNEQIASEVYMEDCHCVSGAVTQWVMGGSEVAKATMKNCISSKANGTLINTSLTSPLFWRVSSNLTIDNCVLYNFDGTYADQLFYLANCDNVEVTRMKFSATQDHTEQGVEQDGINAFSKCNNLSIIGLEIMGDGFPGASLLDFSGINNVKVRAIGMIDEKILFGSDVDYFVWIRGICTNFSFARCWKTGGGQSKFAVIPTTAKDVEFINCSGDYSGELEVLGTRVYIRGTHGASGNMNASDGWETLLENAYGSGWNDGFRSDTTGQLVLTFPAPTDTDTYYTVTAGSPRFNNSGQLFMESGDIVEFEMPYFAKGHTAFTGVITRGATTGASGPGSDGWGANITADFQYDTGSGYNGTWLDIATPANLTAITGMVGGIKIKVRLQANATIAPNGLALYTTTTITDQKNNLYPIDQEEYTFSLTGLQNPTEVRVYRVSDNVELAGEEDVTTGTFNYTYTYSSDTDVVVVIHALGYIHQRIPLTLSNGDSSIPIVQIVDRQYDNP